MLPASVNIEARGCFLQATSLRIHGRGKDEISK